MSNVKGMSNILLDSVLLRNLRLFSMEQEKPKVIVHENDEQYDPPEPITMDKLKDINNKLGMIYTCFPEGENLLEVW